MKRERGRRETMKVISEVNKTLKIFAQEFRHRIVTDHVLSYFSFFYLCVLVGRITLTFFPISCLF